MQCLLVLVEQQQEAIQKLTCPKSLTREPTSQSESQLDVMWEEIFNLIPGTVNTRWGTAVASHSLLATPVFNKASFEDIPTEVANFTPSHQSRHVIFADMTPTPHYLQAEVAVPAEPTFKSYPEGIGLHTVTCEFQKMQEPKISKLKGGSTSSARLDLQSWQKDILVHMQERRLTQTEAIQQLVKDFSAKWAWDKVQFCMGIVAEEDQSSKASLTTCMMPSSQQIVK